MKLKFSMILFFAISFMVKTHAQSNEQEAQVTYTMAKEEYEKGNYTQALIYLDKVETLSDAAKVKTSYYKAKCYAMTWPKGQNQDSVITWCINSIKYYFDNGKDEDK